MLTHDEILTVYVALLTLISPPIALTIFFGWLFWAH